MRDGPPRGGTRGGRDQFSWENVKNDAHRENYLGASVHAPVGRWQKGRDLLWYTRERGAAARAAPEIQDEQAEIRMREDALMREALGLPPPTAPQREPEKRPDASTRRGDDARPGPDDRRGGSASRTLARRKTDTHDEDPSSTVRASSTSAGGSWGKKRARSPSGAPLNEDKERRRQARKAEKRERKAEKKERKAEKRRREAEREEQEKSGKML